MPIEFDGNLAKDSPLASLDDAPAASELRPAATTVDCLDIALLNNMPDAALQATERQFVKLLGAAAGKRRVRLHFFSLPEIARGEAAAARLAASYSPAETLRRGRFDALIVTGTEPRTPSLVDEPYWDSLTEIVDWAEHNTISTIWSCLAAHAAVLHLDGVARQPFERKCSGVFDCIDVAGAPLLAGAPAPLRMPHSRWNDLRERDLAAHGYSVLTRSAAGVDLFAKQWRSLFLFLQGHPEYAANALFLEYRRDVARYLRGERADYPSMPANYFDAASEKTLTAFAGRAEAERHPELFDSFPKDVGPRTSAAKSWQATATALFGNWLAYIADRKL